MHYMHYIHKVTCNPHKMNFIIIIIIIIIILLLLKMALKDVNSRLQPNTSDPLKL